MDKLKTKPPGHTPTPPKSPDPIPLKRKRRLLDPITIQGLPGVVPPSFTPFLVIMPSDKEKKLNNLSVFAISKALKASGAGRPKSVSRYQSGSLMIQVTGRQECENLKKCTRFCDTPVTVESHKSLNRSKGVVKSRDLGCCSEEEMVRELDGVVEARRVSVRRGDTTIQTNTWILTFNSTRPPPRIQIEYLELEVRPYVPNPMRCFNCHRYGHTKANCRRKAACPRCGKEDHEEVGCKADPRCLNCQGRHAANSKDCPKWIEEKAVLTYRATYGGTFAQAKAVVCPARKTSVSAKTFAEVARAGGSNQSGSRDISVPNKSSAVSQKTQSKAVKRSSTETVSVANKFGPLSEVGAKPAPSTTPTSTTVSIPLPPTSILSSPPSSLPSSLPPSLPSSLPPSLPSSLPLSLPSSLPPSLPVSTPIKTPTSPLKSLMEVEVSPPQSPTPGGSLALSQESTQTDGPAGTDVDPTGIDVDPCGIDDGFVVPLSSSQRKRGTTKKGKAGSPVDPKTKPAGPDSPRESKSPVKTKSRAPSKEARDKKPTSEPKTPSGRSRSSESAKKGSPGPTWAERAARTPSSGSKDPDPKEGPSTSSASTDWTPFPIHNPKLKIHGLKEGKFPTSYPKK